MVLFAKTSISGHQRQLGTGRIVFVKPHVDSRPAREFESDMNDQAAWLADKANEAGFAGVGDMLNRDPALFERLAYQWRLIHQLMMKSDPHPAAIQWKAPTSAQAESGNYKKARIQWNGIEIAIECPAGTTRSGIDRDGHAWQTRMLFPYGYVVGSMGVDGDPVDVYVGPNERAPMVYVVHQRKAGRWSEYDEDKVMLGFDSAESARAAFLAHYDNPKFLGDMTVMSVGDFARKVMATTDKPTMIKSGAVVMFFRRVKPQATEQ